MQVVICNWSLVISVIKGSLPAALDYTFYSLNSSSTETSSIASGSPGLPISTSR